MHKRKVGDLHFMNPIRFQLYQRGKRLRVVRKIELKSYIQKFRVWFKYGLKFRIWFKYGLKAQKLLAQGVLAVTYDTPSAFQVKW